jgi:hypothetical protein
MARPEVHPEPAVRIDLVARLARAAGLGGMAGGQMLDLAAEGRFDGGKPRLGESDISTLQWMKTGALIHFACVAGGVLGKASAEQIDALSRYGAALGRAFQIADDLLDVEGDAAAVRTRRPARPRWSRCSASPVPGSASRIWWRMPIARSASSAPMRRCSRRPRVLLPNEGPRSLSVSNESESVLEF